MGRWSLTGSFPRTRTCPASACSSPQHKRIDVVLPAPSGPITPNISPRRTSRDSSLTATVSPYRFVTASKEMTVSMSGDRVQRDFGFHRHARFENALRVVDRHPHAVNQLGSFFRGLHVPRGELGLRRNERH